MYACAVDVNGAIQSSAATEATQLSYHLIGIPPRRYLRLERGMPAQLPRSSQAKSLTLLGLVIELATCGSLVQVI